jgi:hypothetical protein
MYFQRSPNCRSVYRPGHFAYVLSMFAVSVHDLHSHHSPHTHTLEALESVVLPWGPGEDFPSPHCCEKYGGAAPVARTSPGKSTPRF